MTRRKRRKFPSTTTENGFLFPEKYWKQLNFYYNTNKAWIPAKSTDKLKSLEDQEPARRRFIRRLMAECG